VNRGGQASPAVPDWLANLVSPAETAGSAGAAGSAGLSGSADAGGPVDGGQAGGGLPGSSLTSLDEPTRRRARGQAGSGGEPRDQEAAARQICLRMLTAAPRTQAQLATALRKRGIPADVADAVLGRFAEVRLIDDAAFAAAWVESRHHGRGLAGRALAAELRQRGVAQPDIQAAVGSLDPERELATARELAARRLAGTRGQPLVTRVRRLTAMLARKGYPAGLAYRVVREALDQEGIDLAASGIDLGDPADTDVDG
jgi:regulatory protein